MKNIKIHPLIYNFSTILFLEIIIKIIITKQFINQGLIYMIIFTIPIVLLLTTLSKIFKEKTNRLISIISMFIITIYFEVQYIFYTLFSVPFSFSTIGLADQALDFTNVIKDTIQNHFPIFLLILCPFILLIIINKKIDYTKYQKESIFSLLSLLIISYFSTFLSLIPNQEANHSISKLYYNIDNKTSMIDNFGILTYTKIDIKRQLFGYESELIFDLEESPTTKNEQAEEEIYKDNILNLDLPTETKNKTLNILNKYISTAPPTKQSTYTGMFKDKNLIFILAEGFNEIAIDEVRTPTLYKLANNGFVFKNFYSPVYLSTTGGEFQATTGLIPTQEILKNWKSKKPTIKYAIGNSFSEVGYKVQSYHNWTYKYYTRDVTMKTLGFNNYTGCGNGLEKKMNCKWLPFDTDMIEVTTSDYLTQEEKFATYYVTVSGHSPYNAGDNIAKKHLDTVSELTYSDSVKYYLAAQVELDKMLELLINKLEESGQLKDTVIALVGDHYPYTLSADEINEISTYKKDGTIEVNKSNFILWNSEIEEPIIIDKVGSQIDVLPTLLNLFGIKYDSRLIIGKDILSNSEGLAIFSNYSWVSDYGTYNSTKKEFTPKEGKKLENQEEYIKSINNKISNYFSVSKMIIDTDYYKYIQERE